MGLIPVRDSDFFMSHPHDMSNIPILQWNLINLRVEYINADDVTGYCLDLMNKMLWILIKLRRNTDKGLSYTIETIKTID